MTSRERVLVGAEPSRVRARPRRLFRPSFLRHRRPGLSEAAAGSGPAARPRLRLRCRPAVGHRGPGRARTLRRRYDRDGTGLCPASERLDRLDAAGRHALPRARLDPHRERAAPLGDPGPGRQDPRPNARRGPVLRADLFPAGRGGRSSNRSRSARPDHVDRHRQPAGPGRSRHSPRGRPTAPQQHRPGHHRPVRRQSLRDRPILLPQRHVHDDAGRRAEEGPRVPRRAHGDPLGEPGPLPRRGRAVHRHHPLRRRPRHADRADDVAADVLRVLQAPPPVAVEPRQEAGQRQGHAPLLRRRSGASART